MNQLIGYDSAARCGGGSTAANWAPNVNWDVGLADIFMAGNLADASTPSHGSEHSETSGSSPSPWSVKRPTSPSNLRVLSVPWATRYQTLSTSGDEDQQYTRQHEHVRPNWAQQGGIMNHDARMSVKEVQGPVAIWTPNASTCSPTGCFSDGHGSADANVLATTILSSYGRGQHVEADQLWATSKGFGEQHDGRYSIASGLDVSQGSEKSNLRKEENPTRGGDREICWYPDVGGTAERHEDPRTSTLAAGSERVAKTEENEQLGEILQSPIFDVESQSKEWQSAIQTLPVSGPHNPMTIPANTVVKRTLTRRNGFAQTLLEAIAADGRRLARLPERQRLVHMETRIADTFKYGGPEDHIAIYNFVRASHESASPVWWVDLYIEALTRHNYEEQMRVEAENSAGKRNWTLYSSSYWA